MGIWVRIFTCLTSKIYTINKCQSDIALDVYFSTDISMITEYKEDRASKKGSGGF